MKGNLIGRTTEASDRKANWQENDSNEANEKLRRRQRDSLAEKTRGMFEWHGDVLVSTRLPGGARRAHVDLIAQQQKRKEAEGG